MPDLTPKEFSLENTDTENNNGRPILIKVRQATQKENRTREKYLSKMKDLYSSFIEDGSNGDHILHFEWSLKISRDDFINDKQNRFQLIKNIIVRDICLYDVYLSLGACDFTDKYGKSSFKFKNGLVDRKNSSAGGWYNLPENIRKDIFDKVLEINPTWAGEAERMINSLVKTHRLQQPTGNFADLALRSKSVSVFKKSKSYISSLVEEINQDVFENNGKLQTNVPLVVLGRREVRPPPENIILALHTWSSNGNKYLRSYIGVLEHGDFELRIVAKREKSSEWDIDIEDIIDGLRNAIKWWKEEGLYTDEEQDSINAA